MRYEVITEALRKEAERWDGIAADTEPVNAFIASAKMGVTAFLMVSPSAIGRLLSMDTLLEAPIQHSAYEEFRSTMEELTRGAITEFGQIGDALIKMANKYDEAEEICELEFSEIYRTS